MSQECSYVAYIKTKESVLEKGDWRFSVEKLTASSGEEAISKIKESVFDNYNWSGEGKEYSIRRYNSQNGMPIESIALYQEKGGINVNIQEWENELEKRHNELKSKEEEERRRKLYDELKEEFENDSR